MIPHVPPTNNGVTSIRLSLGEASRGITLLGEGTPEHKILLLRGQLLLFRSIPGLLSGLERKPHNFVDNAVFMDSLRRGEFEPPLDTKRFELDRTVRNLLASDYKFELDGIQRFVNNMELLHTILVSMADARAKELRVTANQVHGSSLSRLLGFAVGLDEKDQDRAKVRRQVREFNKFVDRNEAGVRLEKILQDICTRTDERWT